MSVKNQLGNMFKKISGPTCRNFNSIVHHIKEHKSILLTLQFITFFEIFCVFRFFHLLFLCFPCLQAQTASFLQGRYHMRITRSQWPSSLGLALLVKSYITIVKLHNFSKFNFLILHKYKISLPRPPEKKRAGTIHLRIVKNC